eukprot:9418436-Prorocentrum_lima.AAC.1
MSGIVTRQPARQKHHPVTPTSPRKHGGQKAGEGPKTKGSMVGVVTHRDTEFVGLQNRALTKAS